MTDQLVPNLIYVDDAQVLNLLEVSLEVTELNRMVYLKFPLIEYEVHTSEAILDSLLPWMSGQCLQWQK